MSGTFGFDELISSNQNVNYLNPNEYLISNFLASLDNQENYNNFLPSTLVGYEKIQFRSKSFLPER
jgi:hypothetical protein